MGHDIWARKLPEQEVDDIHAAYMDVGHHETAHDDYQVLTEECYVSQYRRSAFDPYNKVIYRALGCEDLYMGCSGVGETHSFNHFEVQEALDMLPYIVADKAPDIDTSVVDKIFDHIKDSTHVPKEIRALFDSSDGTIEARKGIPDDVNLDEETRFLTEILDWMTANDKDSIDIFFG